MGCPGFAFDGCFSGCYILATSKARNPKEYPGNGALEEVAGRFSADVGSEQAKTVVFGPQRHISAGHF